MIDIYETKWLHPNGSELVGPEGTLQYMLKIKAFEDYEVEHLRVGESKKIHQTNSAYTEMVITKRSVEAYQCNCCQTQQPGDGVYTICHSCGWENDPGELQYPDCDGGPNHMSLNEGRATFTKHGWYKYTDPNWIK